MFRGRWNKCNVPLAKQIQSKLNFHELTSASPEQEINLWFLVSRSASRNKPFQSSRKPSARDIISALLSPSTLKPFAILTVYFGMYQFSGVNTITFYAVEIFQATGTTMNKTSCTIMLGVVRVVFTIIACIAMRRYGRRPLTFISSKGERKMELNPNKLTFHCRRYWMWCVDVWTGYISVLP